jgi:mono/diheme cytochrome c family protein
LGAAPRMTFRRFSILGVAAIVAAGHAGAQTSTETTAATPREFTPETAKAFFTQYCFACHNQYAKIADIVLDTRDFDHIGADPEIWERVVRKLNAGAMPPQGLPRPEAAAYKGMVSWLTTSLDAAVQSNPNPGRSSIHRLNRAEYGNAIRDLLGLEVDASELLPADDEGYGFDNIADVLRVSPSLLEQYLSASAKIAALAVGDPSTPPIISVYRAPPDLAQGAHVEGLPLGTRGGVLIKHNFPLDASYDFNVFLRRNIVGYMTGLEWAHELEISIDGERVFLSQVGGPEDNAASDANFSAAANAIDERLRTRVFVPAGPHEVAIAFLERSSAETQEPLELHTRNLDLQDMNGLPVVDYVNVAGPYDARSVGDTPSRRHIFLCRPESLREEGPCAERILAKLAHLAYRRPTTPADMSLLLDFYHQGREQGGNFDAGIRTALRVLLTSPDFLFRSEPDPKDVAPGALYAVDDLALASRLSFFLWSSLPDEQLLQAAEHGKLADPKVYEQQIRRMLADPRSRALVENFAGQWLYLRNLQSARPDVQEFPDFDENLRRSMRTETELFFASIMREDRSVLELLTADYTFVNQRLAEHYGIPNVYGSQFRKIQVTDPARVGLLGHGSIHTVTSYPNRTSPVLRGKYILTNILGTPPPAPPPNVPALEENAPGKEARSVRARLQEHRANPVCATCHNVMDPIGFALENFDAVGAWRTKEPGGAIDSSGQMANGTPVNGPETLRAALTAEPEHFVGIVTEKLLTYALGRGLEAFDMPTVRSIVRDAANDDYKFSAVVLGIANSTAFRMKAAQQPATTTAFVASQASE